jgi:diguanylate cyclase (GGDEF)-like protein/PAS domain S-box-containing protein
MAEKIVFPTPHLPAQPHLPGWTPTELLGLLTRHSGAPTAVIGRDLHFIYVNAIFATWFGLTPEQLVGVPIRDVYGEHNNQRYMPFLERAFAGEVVRYQRQVRNPTGTEEWHTICLTPCRDANGEVFAIVTAALDVHELRITTEALLAANQRLSSHMENSPLAVIETDHELRIVYCSARGGELLGWQSQAVQGRPLWELLALDPTDTSPLGTALQRLHRRIETRNRAEATHRRADGSMIHCEWFSSALTNAQGELVSIMALIEDVSVRVLAAQQLQHLAERDSLTGLYNRSAFQVRLALSLDRARETDGSVALLFIDLDGFKGVNDGFGHAAGDDVLREVAQRLSAAVRDTDTVARLGGDEFAVMLDADIDASTAEMVSRRIFAALERPFDIASTQMPIGASIGVAAYPPLEGHAGGLIKNADQAMYEAKRAGKGCVRYALAP